jgi:hypothetical protein
MAVVITKPVTEVYDQNVVDNSGGSNLLALAQAGDPEAARYFSTRPLTFTCEGQCVGNEAVTIALLAPVNLTTLGVLFPASSVRNIRCRVWSRRAAAAEAGYTEKWYSVAGGATPTIAPDATLAAIIAAANNPAAAVRIPNNNSAAAPHYGEGIVIMDAVATTNVIVGVQNIVGLTNVAGTATLMRWRLEVWVDSLVILPVAA